MRILWLKTDMLHPVDRGGRIRSYQMLREIARTHEVHYLALDDGTAPFEARAQSSEYCSGLDLVPIRHVPKRSPWLYADLARNLLTAEPYAIAKYDSAEVRERARALTATGAFDVVVADFLAMAPNVPRGIAVTTVLFQHNVEAEIWRRHAAIAASPLQRAYFRMQWQRMRRLERAACHRFDHVIAVSEHDADVLRVEYDAPSVSWVPTGVDLAYFGAMQPRQPVPGRLLFLGSLDWMPNEDAIEHLLSEILPRVRERYPSATLDLVGRNPSAALAARAASIPGVTLHANVPDVRPFLRQCSVFVVPLRVGGGTRLKLYEALASGLPTVSTPVGAEGLPLRDNEHLLLAESVGQQVEAITRLLTNVAQAEALGSAGAQLVQEHCSWAAVAAAFVAGCKAAMQVRARPSGNAA